MPRKKYLINLNDEERQTLQAMTRKGQAKARQYKRAMILLKADEGMSDPTIMAALNVSRPCVERIRKRFVADGIERALNEDPRPGQKRRLDGRAEATLVATACTMKNYIPDIQRFCREAQALINERNDSHARVNWHFRTDDARIKLKQLYPSISP